MKDLSDLLKNFGISPTASRVYLALLDLGKATAGKVAERAGTYKPNTYAAMAKLQEIGLVTQVFETRKLYLPTNPEKLPQLLEEMREKENQRLALLSNDILIAMPSLKARYGKVKESELFEVYRGKKAFRALMREIVKEKPKTWKGFGNLQVQHYFPEECKRWFKRVPIKLFSTKSPEMRQRVTDMKKITSVSVSYLPKEVYMPIVWVVFGDNVLINIYEPDVVSMRIKSQAIVKTFSNQFDYLWEKNR